MTPIVTALMGIFILSAPQSGWAADNQAQAAAAAVPSYQVTLTAYNAVPGQTDEDPTTTASGAYSNPSIVAARSVDLADQLPFGTVISIEPTATSSPECGSALVNDRLGLRVVADSMNSRMHKKIDVLFASDDTVTVGGKEISAARILGVCKVKIRVVGRVDISKMPKNQIELVQMLGRSGALAVRK